MGGDGKHTRSTEPAQPALQPNVQIWWGGVGWGGAGWGHDKHTRPTASSQPGCAKSNLFVLVGGGDKHTCKKGWAGHGKLEAVHQGVQNPINLFWSWDDKQSHPPN